MLLLLLFKKAQDVEFGLGFLCEGKGLTVFVLCYLHYVNSFAQLAACLDDWLIDTQTAKFQVLPLCFETNKQCIFLGHIKTLSFNKITERLTCSKATKTRNTTGLNSCLLCMCVISPICIQFKKMNGNW